MKAQQFIDTKRSLLICTGCDKTYPFITPMGSEFVSHLVKGWKKEHKRCKEIKKVEEVKDVGD